MSSTTPAGRDCEAAGPHAGPAQGRRDGRVIAMTLLGVTSGFLTLVAVMLLENRPMAGLIFGVIIGTYLWRTGLATGFRAVAFAILSSLAWMAVDRILPGWADLALWQGLIIAGAVGLLAAALHVIAILVLFAFFRRPRLCLRAILVGGVAGIPIGLLRPAEIVEGCPVVLPEGLSCPAPGSAEMLGGVVGLLSVPLWQGAFAYCFARGFPRLDSLER
jgi:hypothetical protein